MTPTLTTDRLTLRPLVEADAPALVTHLANWEVMKWLSAPPWPYTLEDANWFIAQNYSEHWAIDMDGSLIGVVAFDPMLGYWLAHDEHGQALMSEAVNAALEWHFTHSKKSVTSGHMPKNLASRAVLQKHGFKDTEVGALYSRPLARKTAIQRMELTAERWHSLRTATQ